MEQLVRQLRLFWSRVVSEAILTTNQESSKWYSWAVGKPGHRIYLLPEATRCVIPLINSYLHGLRDYRSEANESVVSRFLAVSFLVNSSHIGWFPVFRHNSCFYWIIKYVCERSSYWETRCSWPNIVSHKLSLSLHLSLYRLCTSNRVCVQQGWVVYSRPQLCSAGRGFVYSSSELCSAGKGYVQGVITYIRLGLCTSGRGCVHHARAAFSRPWLWTSGQGCVQQAWAVERIL